MKEPGCPSGLERLERCWQLQVSRDSLSSPGLYFAGLLLECQPVFRSFKLLMDVGLVTASEGGHGFVLILKSPAGTEPTEPPTAEGLHASTGLQHRLA